MVYVVERYLPGLSRSDLLHGLAKLERAQELRGEAPGVRYLGSTVVLEDEACFCQFEGPTEAAVAEANRRAGLPFDRIVSAVTVQPERNTTMNVSTTIPATVQIRRSRLLGLIGLVAAVAAAVTWAVLAFGVDSGSGQAQTNALAKPAVVSSPIPMTGYLDGITSRPSVVEQPAVVSSSVLSSLSPNARRYVESITSMSPAQLRATFGTDGVDAIDALGLSPKAEQYVRAITSMTPAQLKATFGTSGR
jgi:hypothetical protein